MSATSHRLYRGWAVALLVVLGLALGVPAPASAQQSSMFDQKGDRKREKSGGGLKNNKTEIVLKNNPKFLETFRPVVSQASASTLRVQCDGDDRALAVVVTANGFLLTQAHDLNGRITVVLKDGGVKDAEIVGTHDACDLALLKIDATDLKPIVWADSKHAPVGNWVASVGADSEPVAVGVVSVAAHGPVAMRPGSKSGYLGIALSDDKLGAKINFVEPKGAADKAGLKANDVILSVAGRKTPDAEALIHFVLRHKVGETLALKVRRGTEELDLKATLGQRDKKNDVSEIQNNMGSRLSKVRGGYPVALQHDTVLPPTDCGSPLVNLDGQVVGINIARYGRVETFAIPAEVVRPIVADLLSSHKLTSPVNK